MPYSALRAKFESTNMPENPLATDEYFRDTLRDLSCDKPFFESDQKRDDTHAEEFLSLRHNVHRSGEVPDAPDINLELTERDPRGTATDPNFRNITRDSWERAGAYKFYSDSSNNVTEREKRPQVLIAQMREQFYNIKERLKIFTTSKDNSAGASNYQWSGTSVGSLNAPGDSSVSGRGEVMGLPRSNLTTLQSNNAPLGWETTGDAEYKVASYGQVRGRAVDRGDQPNLQMSTYDDKTANLTKFQDQVVSVGLAGLMRDVSREQSERRANGEWQPGITRDQRNTQFKAQSAPGQREAAADQVMEDKYQEIERFIGQLRRQTGVQGQNIESQLQTIQFMDNAISAPRGGVARFKSGEIVASAARAEGFETPVSAAGRGRALGDRPAARQSATSNYATGSQQTARLGSGRQGVRVQAPQTAQEQTISALARAAANQNASGVAPNVRHGYSTDESQAVASFGTKDRFTRGLGSKFVRDQMDQDNRSNAISAMS